MELIDGEIYHIYNRGNNGQQIFFSRDNYLYFLKKLQKEILPHCDVLAYCLMPNHFHLMVKMKTESNSTTSRSFNVAIGILLRSYTRAIQRQQNIKGSLFQQKTKAKRLEGGTNDTINYPAICLHYIHQNPLRAGFVDSLQDWEFSSYAMYAGIKEGFCNVEAGFSITGIQKENFVQESLEMVQEGFRQFKLS
ncbi:MAG TPA: transposase [Sphingobacteriaceae bacterium]